MKNKTFAKAMDIAKKKGHIKVELDFVPVEERLPDDEQSMYQLEILHMSHGMPLRDYAEYEEGRWLAVDGSGDIYENVTHWAEIPVIE